MGYQRISALSPFKFTWGKLLGTTSYSWYLATLSFIGFIGLGLYLEEPLNLLLNQYFVFILCGLFGQYTAMTLSLNAIQFGRDKHYSFRYFVFAFIISSLFCYALMLPLDLKSPTYQYAHQHLNWYQFEIATYPFYLALVAILLFWSILGSYRLIRAEFQYKNLPYVWFGFCVFWIVYFAGFENIAPLRGFFKNINPPNTPYIVMPGKAYLMFIIASALVYISLFSQKHQLISYKKIGSLIKQKKYLNSLSLMPRWCIASICFIVLYFNLVFFGDIYMDSPIDSKFIIHGYIFGTTTLLLMTRDILLVHFLYFSATPKRAALSSILYLTLLHLVLPALFISIGLKNLNQMLLVSFFEVKLIGWIGLISQVILLVWLVKNRFGGVEST